MSNGTRSLVEPVLVNLTMVDRLMVDSRIRDRVDWLSRYTWRDQLLWSIIFLVDAIVVKVFPVNASFVCQEYLQLSPCGFGKPLVLGAF